MGRTAGSDEAVVVAPDSVDIALEAEVDARYGGSLGETPAEPTSSAGPPSGGAAASSGGTKASGSPAEEARPQSYALNASEAEADPASSADGSRLYQPVGAEANQASAQGRPSGDFSPAVDSQLAER